MADGKCKHLKTGSGLVIIDKDGKTVSKRERERDGTNRR